MPLALSTFWNAYRYTDAKSMLFEISKLGIKSVELSFNLTGAMLDEVPQAAVELGLKIISLHNYCPIPDDLSRDEALPDCYSISSLNPKERESAVGYTKRTIDTAKSLGAYAVVLHCGRVEIDDKTKELISLYENGLRETQNFQNLKDGFIKKRAERAEGFLNCAISSLAELNLYAQEKGIILGVENRFYYREIPNFEETGVILNKFKNTNIFYWHDTGHARVMQNLGFTEGKDYLKAYSDNMLGIHFHNVIGCLDHQPLNKGDLDFLDFKPYLKKETLKVIEVHQPATAQDIKDSRSLLERIFNGII